MPPRVIQAPKAAAAAKLLLVVVIDQLPSWALQKYLPHLPQDGVIRQAVGRGVFYPRVRYDYANTFTAPGHAAIHTGRVPADSGVISNNLYDRASGRRVALVQDVAYPVIGYKKKAGAPTVLQVPTMGDVLHRATGGKSKVVSISLKDRAAILPGGKHADLALWFEAGVARFVTSRYYAERTPVWLSQYNAQHPVKELLRPWDVGDAALCARATHAPQCVPRRPPPQAQARDAPNGAARGP